MGRGRWAWFATVSFIAACSSFAAVEVEREDGGDATTDPPDASRLDGTSPDRDEVGDAPVADSGVDPCPLGVGPSMVVVDLASGRSICIDRTEVTAAQYAAFRSSIKDTLPLAGRVPAPCGALAAAALSVSNDAGDLPRVDVSFCSAAYFCVAQGKRLCGSLEDGGAVVKAAGAADPPMEWEGACANGGPLENYPWGTNDRNAAVPAKCLTQSYDPTATAPRTVGAEVTCGPGGNAGPYDMIGNVWELVNGRSDDDGGVSYTFVRGGSYEGATIGDGCKTVHGVHGPAGGYAGEHKSVGFRCCADRQL